MEALLILLLKWKIVEMVVSGIFIGIIIVFFMLVAVFDHVDMRKRRKAPRK